WPILVKAAAGGGGKGMRIVRTPADLPDAMAAAARESAGAFGDDTLLAEKYVEHGRHIEVQVFGDTRGNVVHLGERDCSVQRRHQKVIEEAPAPTLTHDQRTAIRAAGAALAQRVGYVGAGTVEFLLDAETGAFYFLEMNTRLQVEHPVTEMITGIDLVEWQLRVADGQPLPLTQGEITFEGHAIEARIYAEDPYAGFLPQAGTLTEVQWMYISIADRGSAPTALFALNNFRLDSAYGATVSSRYDPMLAKAIAFGADRESARRRLAGELGNAVYRGIATNVGFCHELITSDEFSDCEIDTAWLDGATDWIARKRTQAEKRARALAAMVAGIEVQGRGEAGPWKVDGWRSGGPAQAGVFLGEPLAFSAAQDPFGTSERFRRSEQPLRDSMKYRSSVGAVWHLPEGIEVISRGQRTFFPRHDPFGAEGALASDDQVAAPMPGTVLAVEVSAGDHVTSGQRLGVMEAMKMELALTAPHAGVVRAVGASPGDQVKLGAMLFEVVAEETP
ncbi:MAG: biotin/lipoyl-containing protein, partial [Nocardioides sp.]